MNLELNDKLSTLEELLFDKQPNEVQELFFDFLNTVPYIRKLISKDRKKAIDIPKDESGKIIINITEPHILENMEYFRPTARYYEKYGVYTHLRPNPNPNSEYGKWIREEIRRCYEGYVRKSDGEWITGDYYFFLNYCPMQLTIREKGKKKAKRVLGFPKVWEGHYLAFHYMNQARDNGHHCMELAARGVGKSFRGASLLAKRFILGESIDVNKKVTSYITAYEKKKLVAGDQTLDKFVFDVDWCAKNTQFPNKTITASLLNMAWTMGYKDKITGKSQGTLNSVIGITAKDDEAKLRGTRGVLYVIEEMGSFPRLLSIYNNLLPSVLDGENVFGLIYLIGTAGDSQSDFSSALEMMYNPLGYNLQAVKNVYDKEGLGKLYFTYFFPGYVNRANCYDENGNSDVTKALILILNDRYTVKHNSTDPSTITRKVAEIPITPQEAILLVEGNMFPVVQLTERLNELDNNPTEYDDVYTGDVILEKSGKIKFIPTDDEPIRKFPLKDNKAHGAIEIFKMPETSPDGKIYSGRYIAGLDPFDDDNASTMSLMSFFVLDLWTDRIVCEWTGRLLFADDCFERVRLLCLFYNARCLYENNKKGIYAYFRQRNSSYLLAETPEYLRDKDLVKGEAIGNKALGVNATLPINNFANRLIKEWLIKPVTYAEIKGDEESLITVSNLHFLRNRALIQELIAFNPIINVDRVRALGMLMLYREEKMILYQGNVKLNTEIQDKNYLGNDEFFTKNFRPSINKLNDILNTMYITDLNKLIDRYK